MKHQQKKNQINAKTIAFWIIVFLIIALSLWLIRFVKTESYECINNPLVYGVKGYEVSTGEFTCSCSAPNLKGYIHVTNESSIYISLDNGNNK